MKIQGNNYSISDFSNEDQLINYSRISDLSENSNLSKFSQKYIQDKTISDNYSPLKEHSKQRIQSYFKNYNNPNDENQSYLKPEIQKEKQFDSIKQKQFFQDDHDQNFQYTKKKEIIINDHNLQKSENQIQDKFMQQSPQFSQVQNHQRQHSMPHQTSPFLFQNDDAQKSKENQYLNISLIESDPMLKNYEHTQSNISEYNSFGKNYHQNQQTEIQDVPNNNKFQTFQKFDQAQQKQYHQMYKKHLENQDIRFQNFDSFQQSQMNNQKVKFSENQLGLQITRHSVPENMNRQQEENKFSILGQHNFMEKNQFDKKKQMESDSYLINKVYENQSQNKIQSNKDYKNIDQDEQNRKYLDQSLQSQAFLLDQRLPNLIIDSQRQNLLDNKYQNNVFSNKKKFEYKGLFNEYPIQANNSPNFGRENQEKIKSLRIHEFQESQNHNHQLNNSYNLPQQNSFYMNQTQTDYKRVKQDYFENTQIPESKKKILFIKDLGQKNDKLSTSLYEISNQDKQIYTINEESRKNVQAYDNLDNKLKTNSDLSQESEENILPYLKKDNYHQNKSQLLYLKQQDLAETQSYNNEKLKIIKQLEDTNLRLDQENRDLRIKMEQIDMQNIKQQLEIKKYKQQIKGLEMNQLNQNQQIIKLQSNIQKNSNIKQLKVDLKDPMYMMVMQAIAIEKLMQQ